MAHGSCSVLFSETLFAVRPLSSSAVHFSLFRRRLRYEFKKAHGRASKNKDKGYRVVVSSDPFGDFRLFNVR